MNEFFLNNLVCFLCRFCVFKLFVVLENFKILLEVNFYVNLDYLRVCFRLLFC